MVVETQAPDVVEARASVFEFLLLNHPLDCPVCDKDGECPLQDFSYSFGPEQSRMEFERRTFDGEGVKADVDFGPTLMLNRNRCILYTRCVRFMREVDGDAQINIIDRGSGSEIATFQDEGVHSLLSGNLTDVCPVGALTTKDYRFKSRPWDSPTAADTMCTFCSKGCSTTFWLKAKPEWARGARLARVTPRFNPDVNGYWMCDIGRFEYHWVESEERLRRPMVRTDASGLEPRPWDDAVDLLVQHVSAATEKAGPQAVRFLVSAHASNEEMFRVSTIATHLGLPAPVTGWRTREKRQSPGSQFRIPAEDAPNVQGARDLGLAVSKTADGSADLSELRDAVQSGAVSCLYVLDPGPAGSLGSLDWPVEARASGTLAVLIVQGVLESALSRAADVVLPGGCFVEKDGSYTNDQGRVQAASKVLEPVGDAKEDWDILTRLGAGLSVPVSFGDAQHVRAALTAEMSGNLAYANLASFEFARPMSAQHWLQASNPSERWKWEVMFRDLPPVKGATPVPAMGPNSIPLEPVD